MAIGKSSEHGWTWLIFIALLNYQRVSTSDRNIWFHLYMKIYFHFFWFASMEATGINLDRQVISSCSISALEWDFWWNSCGKCQCKQDVWMPSSDGRWKLIDDNSRQIKIDERGAVDTWWNIDDGCIRSIMYYSSYCLIYIHGKIRDFWCNCLSFGVLTHLQKKSWPCEWHYGTMALPHYRKSMEIPSLRSPTHCHAADSHGQRPCGVPHSSHEWQGEEGRSPGGFWMAVLPWVLLKTCKISCHIETTVTSQL